MASKCPICHSENPATVKFCGECGAPLGGHEPNLPESGPGSRRSQTETLQAPLRELTTGSTFAGRYQVIEELGRGGMGRVYKVFDTAIKEKVALKLIRPEVASDKETIERFSNEIRLSRKIGHRNVCRMFDLGEAEGARFITMEYVHGEDLKSMIRMSGSLSLGMLLSVGKQVADGLSEAHGLGVVHRDLKPQNVMIDRNGNAKVMDFGIARSVREKGITGPSVMIGTPEYMSPEQAEAKEVDPRSDVYSLGIILYEMATSRVPFEGETALAVAMKHKGEAPKNPKQINPSLPDDLAGVILKCLEKDKAKRYQSAGELRAELARIEDEIPTADRAAPQRKPTGSQAVGDREGGGKRNRLALYGAAVVVLALIAYAGVRLFPGRGEVLDSIAVLPFENVNADPDTDYLCDGIAETIINKLSQLSGLKKVIARNSVFTYKGKNVDAKQVGRELGVNAVLLTRMARLGDRLTISPTLVRAKDNSQLWGERYDRKFEDIFSIEENIAATIVQALQLKLTKQDQEKISERPIDNAAAYELFLQARREIWRFTRASLDRAFRDLQNALDIIGPNALLYSAMSSAYFGYVNIGARQEDALAKAEEYARKAVALDPECSSAHHALGTVLYFKGNHESIRHYRKALELSPNSSWTLFGLALSHLNVGKPSKARPFIDRLKKVDPLNLDGILAQGYYDYYDGRFDLALDSFRKCYQSDPEYVISAYNYALLLARSGAANEAYAIIDQYSRADPDNVISRFGLLFKSAMLKDKEKAREIMTIDFIRTCRRDPEWSFMLAEALALLDERREALDWLENAVNRGFINYPFMSKHDTFLDNLRGEERFKKLMERVKYEWEHFEE